MGAESARSDVSLVAVLAGVLCVAGVDHEVPAEGVPAAEDLPPADAALEGPVRDVDPAHVVPQASGAGRLVLAEVAPQAVVGLAVAGLDVDVECDLGPEESVALAAPGGPRVRRGVVGGQLRTGHCLERAQLAFGRFH